MSIPKRASIYLSTSIANIKKRFKGNFSGRLSSICDRYETIVNTSFPDDSFNHAELLLLKETLKDVFFEDAKSIQNQTICFYIKNAIKTDAIDKKYEVDCKELIKKIENLSYVQLVSLIEYIEEYWNKKQED